MNPIRFEHIPEVGLSLKHDLSAEDLSQLLAEPEQELAFSAREPAQIQFRLERDGRDVHVTGLSTVQLIHPCIRCLEPVSIQQTIRLDLQLEKPNLIDLMELFREELFLELPTYPACEPECAPHG